MSGLAFSTPVKCPGGELVTVGKETIEFAADETARDDPS